MTTRLGKRLEQITGMNPSVLGEKNLARIVRERMSVCGIVDEEQYYATALSSSREMEVLIEAFVIPETSFFRDKGPFTFLQKYVCDEWVPAPGTGPLRVLSAPCSSGEEPYSIAIMLREGGLEPDDYQIDALDISRSLLQKAERAAFTPYSFRGVPESLRDRYFVRTGDEYVLKDTVRHGVQFIHGNLVDELVLADKKPYDIVFCRNLMIYLGAEARTRLVRVVERLLACNGLLFVGHAETSCFPATKFAPIRHRRAFGLRKAEAGDAAGVPETSSPIIAPPPPIPGAPKRTGETNHSAAASHDVPRREDSIEKARQLANLGCLPEAAEMCRRLLRDDEANADIYCLLGTILHGQDDLQRAEECFSRAIYFDERCYDAIFHLSLIKEHRGDSAGAKVLRHRAARIRPQTRIS